MREPKIYIKILVNYLVAILVLLTFIFVLPKVLRFFLPFVIGWIIAMICNPLVKFMESRIKIVRRHSSAIIIIVVLALVSLGLYFGIAALIQQIMDLKDEFPKWYADLQIQIEAMVDRFKNILPEGLREFGDNIMDSINQYISRTINNMDTPTIQDAGIVAKSMAEVLFMAIITVLSAYFFIAEKENVSLKIRKHVPFSIMKQWDMVTDNFKRAVGGYFKAQFKIMIVITVVLFVGFQILHMKYSFLLAIAIAFLDLLPVFGTGAVLWPLALFEFIQGSYVRAVWFLVIYFICQVLKQLLQPKMVGDSIGISAFQTLVFMFIGYQLAGLFGLIIGIPIGMVLANFYRAGAFERLIRGFQIVMHDLGEFMKF